MHFTSCTVLYVTLQNKQEAVLLVHAEVIQQSKYVLCSLFKGIRLYISGHGRLAKASQIRDNHAKTILSKCFCLYVRYTDATWY